MIYSIMFYLQVDGAIQETKNLMNIIAKVVTTSFICATKVSLMNIIAKVVTSSFICATKVSLMNIITKVVTTSFICATKVSFICTVKPILRGHDLWDKEKVTL
jgi:hypothetical protein